ncbi:hypothetical protein SAMN05444680_12660 [Variovorax sp. YR216]|nr:hypothetical protein SAMN05444680_12660 [Variovorax sp. YR216]
MKAFIFIAATFIATLILVAAGLEEAPQGPRVGWFGVSQQP